MCTAQNGEKVKNVDHIDCSFGVVSTRRRGLGIFTLAELGPQAEKVACRFKQTARRFRKVRKGQACNP
jgi:hypothetical protein